MDKDFGVHIEGLGFNTTGYPGAFTPKVARILEDVVFGKVLHLFSGTSTIGEVRVDIERPEATLRQNVFDFISNDSNCWDFVILDPPYELKRKSKLEVYGRTSSVAADVQLRRALCKYFREHTRNILWLDMCAPLPAGFKRKELWFLFPGGYHTLRILSWLVKVGNRQDASDPEETASELQLPLF